MVDICIRMGPKKEAPKAGGGEVVEGEDPTVLLKNYQTQSKLVGLPTHSGLVSALSGVNAEGETVPLKQILVDDTETSLVLGSGGTRVLMQAILGSGSAMKGGPFKLVESIRLWRSKCSDDGAAAIAEVLRLGGGDVKIAYLELLDNNIGHRGALALGTSLSQGNNLSLLTLKLDYNSTFGTEGLKNLCRGLRTNISMKQLHVMYCKIDEEGGKYLAEVLGSSKSALELLNVGGNKLGGKGLSYLCSGLIENQRLEKLQLNDNYIDENPEDLDGLAALRDCIMTPTVAVTSIDLLFNRIGEPGANVLLPAFSDPNCKISEFLVDSSLPLDLFEQIFKSGGGGKKKKGKKK